MSITNDALRYAFNFLDARSLCKASQVSKQWKQCEFTGSYWKFFFAKDFNILEDSKSMYLSFKKYRFNLLNKKVSTKQHEKVSRHFRNYPITALYDGFSTLHIYNFKNRVDEQFPLKLNCFSSLKICHINQKNPNWVFIDLKKEGFAIFDRTLQKIVKRTEAEFDKFIQNQFYLTSNPVSITPISTESSLKDIWWNGRGGFGYENFLCIIESGKLTVAMLNLERVSKK